MRHSFSPAWTPRLKLRACKQARSGEEQDDPKNQMKLASLIFGRHGTLVIVSRKT